MLLGYFQVCWVLDRKPASLPKDKERWPSVDIFIPTYNEPLDVVKPTVYAALTLVEKTADAPFHADNAKMIAGIGALDSARANIQLHGGMGFTQELNAHLFLKRVHVLNEIGGTPRELQHRVLVLPKEA